MTFDCLWLARTLPFPQLTGDKIYTGRLAEAVAAEGASITFLGLAGDSAGKVPAKSAVRWRTVPGGTRSRASSLLSTMPLVAAGTATPEYRRAVRLALAEKEWDSVIIDQYGMGWVLDLLPPKGDPRRPALVHIAHDHEESVTKSLWRNHCGSPLHKAFLGINYLKALRMERRIVDEVDLITTITPEDAATFRSMHPDTPSVVLTPGYAGHRVAQRRIDADVPRRVIVFGSFQWVAKQLNLRKFLEVADPACARAGVEIHVVGSMPDGFRREISGGLKATKLVGFVDDPTPHFMGARIAAVAEEISGGFKLKLLEYIFHRTPVIALEACTAGLPADLAARVMAHRDLDSLVRGMIASIDDFDRLNRLQDEAYGIAGSLFEWSTRGRKMLDAMQRLPNSARAAVEPQVRTA